MSIQRILDVIKPEPSTTAAMLYDAMESQSSHQLPQIYVPFDADNPRHWDSRGAAFDFAGMVGTGRVLDIGPGDGWPSLIIAPFVEEVVGVDASRRRVDVCTANAAVMGIGNASFVHVPAGEPLPFDCNSFDGVVAASSIEQSPDPKGLLREIYRVIKPGGRLRMCYESLSMYRDGKSQELKLVTDDAPLSSILIYDRHISEEWTVQVKLTLDLSDAEVRNVFDRNGVELSVQGLDAVINQLRTHVVNARMCKTLHPSGPTLLGWLLEAGFSSVNPTHNGRWFARDLFGRISAADRPTDMAGVDALVKPASEVVCKMLCPVEDDPWMTATK